MPKQETHGFKYQRRSREDMKERANRRGGNFDTIFKPQFKVWKAKEGKNIIRILPATWVKAKHYGLDIFVNYGIGPDKQSYLSLSKHNQGEDPLAEARREAQRDGDKDYAKALNPTPRILYWIIDRQDEEEGPQLWPAPFTFDKNLANMCVDEDTKEIIEVDNPDEGRDIRFYREGTMLNTDYPAAKMKLLSVSSIHEDEGQENEWLEYVTENALPSVLNFYSYDHIKAQFDGQSKAPDDDEDESATKRSRNKQDADDDEEQPKRHTRQSRVDDSSDDEEEETEKVSTRTRRTKVDEDEDEKPVRQRARRSEPDDDEDEKPARRTRQRVEEPDEDEDADERPTRSRRGKTDDDEDEDEGGSRRSTLRDKLAERRKSRA